VWIGGCFMSGRFLSAPFLLAILLLSRLNLTTNRVWKIGGAVLLLAVGFLWPYSPIRACGFFGGARPTPRWHSGISDERILAYSQTGLLTQRGPGPTPNHAWARTGLKARQNQDSLVVCGGVGMIGYFAGPDVHVLDFYALSDPLLARLPTVNPRSWRIAHYKRHIPDGYEATLRAGENLIADSSLAAYYDKLSILTGGPILSLDRFGTIVAFNLGRYDHLVDEYLAAQRRKVFPDTTP